MTEETLTDPKIEYEYYITGPKGARFILYPVKGKHTTEDVTRAKNWLYRQHDVVSLQIRWKKDGDIVPPPEKIPDYIMIKELKRQLGEKESYIQELEDKIRQMQIDADRDTRKQIKSETLYKQLNAQLDKEKKTNNNLRATISDLIVKLNSNEHNNGTNTQGNLG